MPPSPADDPARPAPPAAPARLPLEGPQMLRLAAQSMFEAFAQAAMGTLVVDREHRIVWISEGYKSFLPALRCFLLQLLFCLLLWRILDLI